MSSGLNLYEILGIRQWHGRENEISDDEIKQAYREALLESHPDKRQQRNEDHSTISIEEIRKAYTILSDPVARKEYLIRLQSGSHGTAPSGRGFVQLGDAVDLDDMTIHEDILNSSGETTTKWTKACRCGHSQGYVVWESDLLNNGSADEIKVPCVGCSLWITVQYSVEE
ncbi:Jjj3p [Sugiyamaella lignohabitans]|uniref:Diphthamide biosynthesis protein 4 n=1 Tax=Sugiyamaella lignohabitans TaxID=796027 RepID=A0A167CSQ9_9ASCO|nr:Jjj3p [Sugiyamaella lignohabitans]ANB12064.1 Jjj3p [Sugiyamaella lignohabitans]